MTTLMKHSKKDDAVSPVVGVMLMIVVTVVIAAVVALFATSVATSTEAAPVVVIDMNATAGLPAEINNKLVMSTRGGDPLDLTKLKVVVTINDGDDGNVYKGLEKDPNVGQFLEIGEKLTIFGGGSYCVLDTNSTIGKGIDVEELVVGEKIKVSVIFNENAILYERELLVKDAGSVNILETSSDPNAKWTSSDGTPAPQILSWTSSVITAQPPDATGNPWLVTITNAAKASEKIVLKASPNQDKTISGILVNGAALDETKTYTGSISLTVAVSEGEVFNVVLSRGLAIGDKVKISIGNEVRFEQEVTEVPSLEKRQVVLGQVKLPVGSKISVALKASAAPRLPREYQLFTVSNDMNGLEIPSVLGSEYNFILPEYTILEGDLGTIGSSEIANPIMIGTGAHKYKVTLSPNSEGTWSPSGTVLVTSGESIALIKNTNPDYDYDYYLTYVDGLSINPYATFKLNDSTAKTVSAAKLGSADILYPSSATVSQDETVTLTVKPGKTMWAYGTSNDENVSVVSLNSVTIGTSSTAPTDCELIAEGKPIVIRLSGQLDDNFKLVVVVYDGSGNETSITPTVLSGDPTQYQFTLTSTQLSNMRDGSSSLPNMKIAIVAA